MVTKNNEFDKDTTDTIPYSNKYIIVTTINTHLTCNNNILSSLKENIFANLINP